MGRRNGRRLRFYEFTDLPPSLPLCRRDPETRTNESNHRRVSFHEEFLRNVILESEGLRYLSKLKRAAVWAPACVLLRCVGPNS